MEKKHIFVVDDEKHIRELIDKYLKKEGYESSVYSDGNDILMQLQIKNPDLIVLDINMPGINGLDLCKEIRKTSEIPIVFVSARDEEFDRILGLELGGDDYLSKPFSPRELLVRIKNIFKRMEKNKPNSDEAKVIISDLLLNKLERTVYCLDSEIKLTTKEYELIEFLIVNSNMPFTREILIERIWGYDYIGETRVIDDLVKRIRKKLKEANSKLNIETVWGYG
ncbi:MAG: response regulator transcription factor, partial [Acidaminobacteraceae bacterium]